MAYDGIFQLRIALLAIKPPIWRRIQVPGTMTLPRVHRVFQVVMGWTDTHLHEFVVRGQRYGQMSRDGGPYHVIPERSIPLLRDHPPGARSVRVPLRPRGRVAARGPDREGAGSGAGRALSPLPRRGARLPPRGLRGLRRVRRAHRGDPRSAARAPRGTAGVAGRRVRPGGLRPRRGEPPAAAVQAVVRRDRLHGMSDMNRICARISAVTRRSWRTSSRNHHAS